MNNIIQSLMLFSWYLLVEIEELREYQVNYVFSLIKIGKNFVD